MLQVGIISLFPDMFQALNYGISGRAIKQQLLQLYYWNPRDYAQDRHHTVDDHPYGGGPGMVMMVQPLYDAIQAAKATLGSTSKVIYLSPQGKRLTQAGVEELAQRQQHILLAGRYEGIDERLVELAVDEEWSIGDYILSGGEIAAMTLIDAMIRLVPGALGHEDSAAHDTFTQQLLEYPQYTRPEAVAGKKVPNILLQGNHEAIRRWRLKQALGRTWLRRPDLLEQRVLNDIEQKLLTEFINEQHEIDCDRSKP